MNLKPRFNLIQCRALLQVEVQMCTVHSAPAFRVKWGGKCRQSISAPSGSINIETWPTRGALRMEVNSPHTEHKTSEFVNEEWQKYFYFF